jgi:tetratricopeptide (TPR) repeat protein
MTIDRSSWFWRRGRAYLITWVVLVVTGVAATPLQETAWNQVKSRQPDLNLADFKDSVGQGMVLGLLGGFRNVMADAVWLRRYYFWEKRDLPNTEALIDLATTLDPRALEFWDNGSANIAYDIAAWRFYDERHAPPAVLDSIKREQAERALRFLDRGLVFHPNNPTLLRDKALIYQFRLNDLPTAADQYRIAAEAPGAPSFLGRIYVELLRQLGRNIYFHLPPYTTADERFIVWNRLQDLEDTLKLPVSERLPLSDAPPGWHPPPPAAPSAPPAHG